MAGAGQYYRNAKEFKEDAFAVLQSRFVDRQAFEQFYESIATPKAKNEFLRVCCTYRYLAKDGDWKLSVPGVDEIIDYLNNSYKLVAVFSLIESLSELRHQDFYEWLSSQESDVFPMETKADLLKQYNRYKASFGAIRRCVAFFNGLDLREQQTLCGSVAKDTKPTENIKKLAEYLYQLRSEFVHKAELVLELGAAPIYSITNEGVYHSALTVEAVFEAFENGVIAYFRHET